MPPPIYMISNILNKSFCNKSYRHFLSPDVPLCSRIHHPPGELSTLPIRFYALKANDVTHPGPKVLATPLVWFRALV